MPKGLQTLTLSFKEDFLTHFGGMILLQRFCNKLRLRRSLQRSLRFCERNTSYRSSDLILALLYAVIAGLRRINKTEILQYNGVFLSLLGLDRFPDQTTLRRFLKRLSPKAIRQLVVLHDQIRTRLFAVPHPRTTLVFDLDSVVLTIYGKAQFARVGYNPKKRGRRSYHPLLCFESHCQEFWHGSLRPGNAASSTGVVPFLKRCLAKAPGRIARPRIRIRADSGFFGKRMIEYLDSLGCGYAVVAREYSTIKAKAYACRFTKLGHGWETGEFRYPPSRWKEPHRFIVVRRPIPEDPVEAKQLTLFKDRKYAYHVIVTNLTMDPWRVWQFYAKRATVEKNIRELFYDYPLGKIPTEDWTANVAFFQISLLAYNLVHWFKRLCLPEDYLYATLDTIRTDFLMLPAKLTKKGSQNILALPKDYHYRVQFEAAFRKIEKFKL
ncbi:MAG: IS1380 family transposase [Candidatus Edwardsbacteria bacterium]|nr:IS1380 family transposase [Candidatus Edwardsbacteria bacterium]